MFVEDVNINNPEAMGSQAEIDGRVATWRYERAQDGKAGRLSWAEEQEPCK